MRLHLLVAAATLPLTACTFDATGLSAESSGAPITTTGDESSGSATTTSTTETDPTEEPTSTTGTPAGCGNSMLDDGEACDNGPANGQGSTCKADCTLNVCGDGYLVPASEGCDDGNMVDDDECSNTCKLTGCGDGVLGAGEECDDGNTVDDDGCTDLCKMPFCGDGNVGMDEQCDDGVMNGDDKACKLDCTTATCGDGKVGPDEACDDGNTDDADGCGNDCTLPGCGDGKLGPGEECDLGEMNNDMGECTTMCKNPKCGDMFVQPGEECDLGGMNSDTGACTTTCKNPKCGDMFVQPGEECDLGDMNNDMGACTAMCKNPKCGDGFTQASEECDDGNMVDNDACSNTCKQLCGNKVIDPGEQCDDGNDKDDDICNNACQKVALVVFVTSDRFQGDLGGTMGANATCNTLADAAGLTGTFKAWISDGNDDPVENFAKTMMPWRRLDGLTVANNWGDLITGSLAQSISVTENNVSLGGGENVCGNADKLVWTDTKAAGTIDGDGHCNEWSSAQGNDKAGAGVAGLLNPGWTDFCQINCNVEARLYCFEQP